MNLSTNFGNCTYTKNKYYDFEEPQGKQRHKFAGRRIVGSGDDRRKHATGEAGSAGHGGCRP